LTNCLQVRAPNGDTLNLETDQVLVAVGRKPNTQGWNLEALAWR
jgi:dihydrolipoamide dehydrogenase